MISVSEARRTILNSVRTLGREEVLLDEALGRVIAGDVCANRNVPPLDNSAMDGYAIQAAASEGASTERPAALPVARTIRAGDRPGLAVPEGSAVKIMTGAPLPPGVDAVVPIEETYAEANVLYLTRPVSPGAHVRRAGEDIPDGEVILGAGRALRPADIGLLASQGLRTVVVHRRPEVAVLATGDEVVGLDETPSECQIYSSNSHALVALVRECGAVPRQLGIARDEPTHLAGMVREGLASDALVTTGGISMGDYDYLKEALALVDVRILFWKVAQKPGKPMTFGLFGEKPVFALPGNPVSTTLSFELYVRPALRKMMGHESLFRPTVTAILEEDLRKKTGRRNFIRGVVRRREGILYASSTGSQGSGILRSMSLANGIIVLPEDGEGARAGDSVEVYLLDAEEALRGEEK